MNLRTGTTLAHYEILEQIGAGGMGEVYRARDAKLGREVALKVLPETLAGNAERIARFQREAQLLAALNHPNIAAVYGIEQAGDKRVLVMELAAGQDLTHRIAQGPLPLDDALDIAHQIATALEEAHDKGIVHRDLKPANVNVDAANDNKVKVLDFGLAKAFEDTPGDPATHLTQSPTISAAMTGANVILGTAAYMSPEQAKGKTADRRADIWALGVVLFEMLTGGQVFGGETISETLAAVMKDAIPWERLPADTPSAVRRLLERCLERDPRQRLQAVGEARIAIERYRRGDADAVGGPGISGAATGPGAGPVPTRSRFAVLFPWAVAFLVTVISAAVVATRQPGTAPVTDAPVRKYRFDVRFSDSQHCPFRIAPDGHAIAYVIDRVLWIRDLGELQPRILVDPGPVSPDEGVEIPFWSPDSRFIGYAATGKLWKVAVDGGNPVAICNLSGGLMGGAWFPDDRVVFSLSRGNIYEVSTRGGDPSLVVERGEDDIDFHDPSPLPGGGFLYALHRNEGVDTIEMFKDGERRRVLRIDAGVITGSPQVVNYPVYSATGHIVYRREKGNQGVWALPFGAASGKVTGDPFLIAPDGTMPCVSEDGTLVYSPAPDAGLNQMVRVDRAGTVTGTLGEPARGLRETALSPDGTRVAYIADEGEVGDVWVLDIGRGSRTRLTFTPDEESSPAWMPGGDRVAFSAVTDSGRAICVRAADGTGETRVLTAGAVSPDISSDGRYLACQKMKGVVGDILVIDLTGQAEARTLVSGGTGFYRPLFSPDDRYLAYLSWETGSASTFIRPVTGGTGKWEIPETGESSLVWREDEILYTTYLSNRRVYRIPVKTRPTLSLGTREHLFDLDPLGIIPYDSFSVSPDGRTFLMVRELETDEIRGGMVVVENWIREFR